MSGRLVYESSMDAFFRRLLAPRLSVEGRGRLKEAGLDLEAPFRTTYPAEEVARWIHLCLPDVYSGQGREEALWQLGRDSVQVYAQTLLGKALLVALRLMGPRRALARLTHVMRTGGNYLSARCEVLSPDALRVDINNHNTMPEYFGGMVEAIALLSGGREVQVALEAVGQGCTLRVRWAEGERSVPPGQPS